MATSSNIAAVVLAAGKGTRMRSALPKVVHRLAGLTLIDYPLRALRSLRADPVVVVVGYEADRVRDACREYGVRYALQAEQKGTGHAVLCALPELEGVTGEVLLLYADLPRLSAETLRRLVETHRSSVARVSLLTARIANPFGFGRIVRNAAGRVLRIVEQRDATAEEDAIDEVNVGIYCVDGAFLARALPRLKPNNKQNEIYLTDIVAMAIEEGGVVEGVSTPLDEVAQVNSRGELASMEKAIRADVNRRWMEAGVTLEDPDTTYIDPQVEIGADTVIGPNVQLHGRTKIGARCRFDGSAFLRDAEVGDDVYIKFSVAITDSAIGDRSEVGPFAHLRKETALAEGVSIGNFVETKKAAIAAGAKARHLAYLGDAEIGEASNIGAGTITCNYDGFRKYRTVIGRRVMIGSDSQLIAPVTVGDDAYVATGTTVRKDVPPGALVFDSKEQRTRPGWVAAKRKAEGAQSGKTSAPVEKRESSKKVASKALVTTKLGKVAAASSGKRGQVATPKSRAMPSRPKKKMPAPSRTKVVGRSNRRAR